MQAQERPPSQTRAEGESVPVFEHPPALIQFLDNTEDAIRKRLAELRFFDRVFLLQRDWMTRITMLMLIAGLVWGAVGGFDAFGFQTQATAYASQQPLHLTTQEIYSSITLHGIRELFGMTQQIEMAVFGLLVINAFAIRPRHKWSLYTSVGLLNLSMILLQGPLYLAPFNDNYFPATGWYYLSPLGLSGASSYVVSPIFFLGWLALCASVLLWAGWVVVHLLDWFRANRATALRRFPVFLWFVCGTLVLLPLTYVPLALATAWDMAAAYAGVPLNALTNQVIFWMFGHSIVYVLFLLPVVALYLLVPILARRPVYSYRFAVASAIMFVVLTPLLGIHHLYLTPLPPWEIWVTMVLSFAIIIPSAITFFSVWMTVKGVPASQWEWNAVALFLMLSFGGAILGGLTGPVNATVGFDSDLHNSMFVLSHFHAITILAIVAGAFALLYAFFPILTGRRWFSAWLARLHFVFTAVGGTVIVLSMDELGNLGVLRREVILPIVPAITEAQLLLLAGIVVILSGQLFLVLNGFLTVLKGPLFSAAGLSFDEAVRVAAQSTCPVRSRVPVTDRPFTRQAPRARRERAEIAWVGSVTILVVLVVVAGTPAAFQVSDAISGAGSYPAGTEFVSMHGEQYYWSVSEAGAIVGAYDNAIVAYPGQWLNFNLTASGATQSLYIPFRNQPAVNVQVITGSTSSALWQAPTTPGVYGVPDGEFNGPWFGQDVAALIVLPAAGGPVPTLAAFDAGGGAGDVYDPPQMSAATASLTGDPEGLFNDSVPGPTLTAAAGTAGSVVTFTWEIPLSSIGANNYLVNVTSTDPGQQQQYVLDHNDTLPYRFAIHRIDPQLGLINESSAPVVVGRSVTESDLLTAGVYLYGITTPIPYAYDPGGESGPPSGTQTGMVMGLWGVLWVSSA